MESNMLNFSDLLSSDQGLQPLAGLLDNIMSLPDDTLNENSVDVLVGMINGTFTEKAREQAVEAVLQNFREEGYNKHEVNDIVDTLRREFTILIEDLHPSEYKKVLLTQIVELFSRIFEEARARFGVYDITLPIKLDEGAITPTYAHDTDACADLYISKDTTISAHTMSNILPTGLHIALPTGWIALVFPRSSIGAKTPLRLSNSVGIIDEEYRGEIGVLYDNVSDSDITFNAGDRIAQMMVMPSYKFRAQEVDTLPDSERGEQGFGSTGK